MPGAAAERSRGRCLAWRAHDETRCLDTVPMVAVVRRHRRAHLERASAGPHRDARFKLTLIFLLPLHPPVLEPDLDLPFGETERVGYLDASPASQVAVKVKLFLQLQRLVASVCLAASFALYKDSKI